MPCETGPRRPGRLVPVRPTVRQLRRRRPHGQDTRGGAGRAGRWARRAASCCGRGPTRELGSAGEWGPGPGSGWTPHVPRSREPLRPRSLRASFSARRRAGRPSTAAVRRELRWTAGRRPEGPAATLARASCAAGPASDRPRGAVVGSGRRAGAGRARAAVRGVWGPPEQHALRRGVGRASAGTVWTVRVRRSGGVDDAVVGRVIARRLRRGDTECAAECATSCAARVPRAGPCRVSASSRARASRRGRRRAATARRRRSACWRCGRG